MGLCVKSWNLHLATTARINMMDNPLLMHADHRAYLFGSWGGRRGAALSLHL